MTIDLAAPSLPPPRGVWVSNTLKFAKVTGSTKVDNLVFAGNSITASAGNVDIQPANGGKVVIDGMIKVDNKEPKNGPRSR